MRNTENSGGIQSEFKSPREIEELAIHHAVSIEAVARQSSSTSDE